MTHENRYVESRGNDLAFFKKKLRKGKVSIFDALKNSQLTPMLLHRRFVREQFLRHDLHSRQPLRQVHRRASVRAAPPRLLLYHPDYPPV